MLTREQTIQIKSPIARASQKLVIRRQLPDRAAHRAYETALAQYFAERGMGINQMKRFFDYRYSKDELRKMIEKKQPPGD